MVAVSNLTKRLQPDLPYDKIANLVLGRRYELSIAFIGNKRSRQLNKTYRGKNQPTNVLAFPLTKDNGEIFIDLTTAIKSAKKFDQTYEFHLAFLLIHACLHLKGYDHGSTMEIEESKLIKLLKLKPQPHNEPSHSHRSGHRDRLNSSRRLRV